MIRPEFDLPINREIGNTPLRHDRLVKVSFTDKLAQVYDDACCAPAVLTIWDQLENQSTVYRDRLKGMQILLNRTQAVPGRTGKQEQEQTSRNHVQAF